MTDKKFVPITIVAILICIVAVILVLISKSNLNKKTSISSVVIPTQAQSQKVFPEVIFDATSTIPETSVSFAYPKAGFYGHGIEKGAYNTESDYFSVKGAVALQSPSFDPNESDEYPSIFVVVYEMDPNIKVAEDISKVLNDQGRLDTSNGSFKVIGSHRFYIYKFPGAGFQAFSVGKSNIISVGFNVGILDQEMQKEQEKLFYQILSHVNFE